MAATAIDGVRERFLIRVGHPKQVWQLDALFSHVFRTRVRTTRPRVLATRSAAGTGEPQRVRTFNPAVAI